MWKGVSSAPHRHSSSDDGEDFEAEEEEKSFDYRNIQNAIAVDTEKRCDSETNCASSDKEIQAWVADE